MSDNITVDSGTLVVGEGQPTAILSPGVVERTLTVQSGTLALELPAATAPLPETMDSGPYTSPPTITRQGPLTIVIINPLSGDSNRVKMPVNSERGDVLIVYSTDHSGSGVIYLVAQDGETFFGVSSQDSAGLIEDTASRSAGATTFRKLTATEWAHA